MVFVDTWAWIALAVRDDQHHEAVKRQQAEFVAAGQRYVTTDYVVAELITQLYRLTGASKAETFVGALLAAIEAGTYRIERVSSQRFTAAWELRRNTLTSQRFPLLISHRSLRCATWAFRTCSPATDTSNR
ncbi:MAG: PIN domain-containing protein [Pirellulales bacterium]